jgi:DNA-binding transcriptional ArsR family regulator
MIGIDNTLTALADPTRRGVVDLLRRRPRRAGELARAMRMSAPAMSRHLRVLRLRGLIEEQRAQHDCRQRVFRLRRQPFADLSVWLRDVQSFWEAQLDSFQSHVARKERSRRQ